MSEIYWQIVLSITLHVVWKLSYTPYITIDKTARDSHALRHICHVAPSAYSLQQIPMNQIVAVDGGASGCRLAAFSVDGELLARVEIPRHASLTLGVEAAWQHINDGLQLLQNKLDIGQDWQPSTLCLGLAGTLQEDKRTKFLQLLGDDIPVRLFTDGHAQLMGATRGQPGVCLAVGTGSVIHWCDKDGSRGMAGGWGYPAGDQGSGAWLGIRLLQIFTAHRDGQQCNSSMMAMVEQHTGSSVSAIQQWTTQSQSAVVAQLAPIVFAAASAGDNTAVALVEEAVAQCLTLVDCAPAHLPVYVTGGIGQQLLAALSGPLDGRLQPVNGDALQGLWYLALTEL